MILHKTQEKILKLTEKRNLAGLSLREIGELIGEPDSPQKIKHHLNKLFEKGLLVRSIDNKKISKISAGINQKTRLISLPIYGSVNCGQALELADSQIKGFLKISPRVLGNSSIKKIKNLFVLKAVGNSMNRANIKDKNIEDGDYIIIDKNQRVPQDGNYIVSVIDDAANVKKFYLDKQKKQIILVSESTQDITPIYIHQDDMLDYLVCGKVIDVMKKPDELAGFNQTSAQDILKDLGPISKSEVEYYENL